MKRLILSTIFALLFYFSNTAFASITFDPVSPQVNETNIVYSCDIGNIIEIYLSDESLAYSSEIGCISSLSMFPINATGIYTIIECDNTISGAICTDATNSTLTLAQSDLGYISETTFEFTAVSIGDFSSLIDIFTPLIEFLSLACFVGVMFGLVLAIFSKRF